MIRWSAIDWDLDLGEISSFPPVGLMYIASYLQYNSNHNVKIIDAIADKLSYDKLHDQIVEYSPDIVGITAFTFTFYDVLKTAKLVKEFNPSIHVCVGGPHTTLFPDETMIHLEIDSLVVGDGEIAFKDLIDQIEEKISIKDVKGVVFYRENGRVTKTIGSPYIMELDTLPFPALELLDYKKYFSALGKTATMATITSSRGCPFKCTYCQVLDKKFRTRSAKNMILEMLKYYELGISFFYFFDDMFNITPERVIEISKLIIQSKMHQNINWSFRGRVDAINEEMLYYAKESGCSQILLGVEDYTDMGLKLIKKNITIQQAFNAVRMIRNHKMETCTNWILGFPHHQTKEDIYNLIKTAIKINSDFAQFSILQLFPGCEMYDECIVDGTLTKDRWSNFVKNPSKIFYVELYTKYFSAEELSELYRYAHIKYYRRFSYILKNIIKIKSFSEFKIKAKAALNVIK